MCQNGFSISEGMQLSINFGVSFIFLRMGLCISYRAGNRWIIHLENAVSVLSSSLKSNTIILNAKERDKTKTKFLILFVV